MKQRSLRSLSDKREGAEKLFGSKAVGRREPDEEHCRRSLRQAPALPRAAGRDQCQCSERTWAGRHMCGAFPAWLCAISLGIARMRGWPRSEKVLGPSP